MHAAKEKVKLTREQWRAKRAARRERQRSENVGRAAKMHEARLIDAIKQPLIWAPIAGLGMALTHIPLPGLAQKSLFLIGDATSGVALFATGLILSSQKLSLSLPTILNVLFKNAVQPFAMWLLAILLGITGLEQHEMILLGALPTAPITAMFAVRYKVYAEESGATILLSTVCSIVTLGFVIALIR